MAPVNFSVTEVRVAGTCPRISYFDFEHSRREELKNRTVTRLWKAGADQTACGSLFHDAIDAFNRKALDAAEVRSTVAQESDPRAIERRLRQHLNRECVNLDALAKRPAAQQQAFIRSVGIYLGELADIIGDARIRGKPTDEILEQLFGDRRRRVDVSFHVGPHGEPVRIIGILDYVFYDWRTAHHRIIDYKLTPGEEPSNDLFQVSLYALMHNVQHRTEPDVGVLYLHPERLMVELTWPQIHDQRHKLFDLLASMAEWHRFDEKNGEGLKPPGEPSHCSLCRWDSGGQCANRLGPKHEGGRLKHWAESLTCGGPQREPDIGAKETPGPTRAWADTAGARTIEIEFKTQPSGLARQAGTPRPRSKQGVRASEAPSRARQSYGQVSSGTSSGPNQLLVGKTIAGGEPVAIRLEALPTHLGVVGAAGSGKTWLAKVIAEEAVRMGVPVLAIDPQGDLVQFLRQRPEPPGLSAEEKALRQSYIERVETRVWTPGSSHGRRLCLDPIRLAKPGDLAHITDKTRQVEEWEGMLSLVAAQLVATAKVGGETDSQETFLLQVIKSLAGERANKVVDLASITLAASDPPSIGVDDPDQFIRKSEREKLARKLNGLRLGTAACLYTGGQRLDLDDMFRPENPGKTALNVLYLNALTNDDQKQFFLAALAVEVYRWMISSPEVSAGRPKVLFYLDEARDFIPAGGRKPPAKEPLVRLFTQGRKYGVACLLCTQSPRSVDYNVFGNCSAKIIGRLESAQDESRVSEWFGKDGSAPAWISGRKGAEAGSFVGRWPFMQTDLEDSPFRSRRLFSLHEGAWSPDRLEREIADSSRATA